MPINLPYFGNNGGAIPPGGGNPGGGAQSSIGGYNPMQSLPNPDIAAAWYNGGFQGQQTQKDIAQLQSNTALGQANIAAQASEYPATLQQQRFGQVFPYLQGQLAKFSPTSGTGTSGASGSASAGFGTGGPGITVGGVYNPQQVQQQVNNTRAQNDRTTATQNAGAAQQMSSRGFGANSPLLQAIYGQNQASNLGTNTSAEQQLRWNAATGNQQAVLNSQQAQANVYGQRQSEALSARGQSLGTMNALIAALSGLA